VLKAVGRDEEGGLIEKAQGSGIVERGGGVFHGADDKPAEQIAPGPELLRPVVRVLSHHPFGEG
jgi:hypothetical protein